MHWDPQPPRRQVVNCAHSVAHFDAAHQLHWCLTSQNFSSLSSRQHAGGLAAWAENAFSNVLWWHLGRNIAAAARVANLPASFLQDLFHRMHQRSMLF